MTREHDVVRPPASRRTMWVMIGVLGVVSLLLHGWIAGYFARAGVLRENDVLFDADPRIYTMSFTANMNDGGWGGRSLVHPQVSNLVYPMVSLATHAVRWLAPQLDFASVSRILAYSVAPVVAAVQTVLVLVLFAELGVGLWGALAMALLSLATISGLIFGSIPESYSLSSLALTALFWLGVRTAKGREARLWPWVVVGCGVAGVTITNLVIVAIVLAIASHAAGDEGRMVWTRTVRAAGLIMLITLGTYEASTLVVRQDAPLALDTQHAGQLSELSGLSLHKLAEAFPLALSNTFVGPAPASMPHYVGFQRHAFTFTYRADVGPVANQVSHAACFALFLLLCVCGVRAMPHRWQRQVCVAAGLVIGFNWILHAVYGTELFLYSQHWEIAELVLVSGVFFVPPPWRVGSLSLFGVCLIGCMINSACVLAGIADRLHAPL